MSVGRYSKKQIGGDPGLPPGTKNGKVPLSVLRKCASQTHLGANSSRYLWPDAARGVDAMHDAAKKKKIKLRLLVGYRTYAKQVEMKKYWTSQGKPNYAATPGTSNHGWSTAMDIDRYSDDTKGIVNWLKANARHFGWDSPMWAMDGTGAEEPWHWEYIKGFTMSTEATRTPVALANVVPIVGAEAYEEKGTTWGWVRPIAEGTETRIVTADAKHCVLERQGHSAKTFAGETYRHEDGKGFVPLRELDDLGIRVGWHDGLVTLFCD